MTDQTARPPQRTNICATTPVFFNFNFSNCQSEKLCNHDVPRLVIGRVFSPLVCVSVTWLRCSSLRITGFSSRVLKKNRSRWWYCGLRIHPAGIKGERNRMVAHPQFTSISNIGVMSKDIATQFDATYPKPRR